MRSFFNHSILQRAQDKGIVSVNLIDLRDYGIGQYKQVDDYAFGGGAGMVLMIEPIVNCIQQLKSKRDYDDIIYLTPDGQTLNQKICNSLSLQKNLLLLCGHYKGVDQRIRDHFITKEISVGDYVLSGGELGAAILCDAVIRLIPGVLSDETSALTDSFQDNLLAPPVYTRPEVYNEWAVPEVLMSGNHAKIDEWRFQQALERTQHRRPDLLDDTAK
jgi:tRNA (guanine37-N1)-methyltransferase